MDGCQHYCTILLYYSVLAIKQVTTIILQIDKARQETRLCFLIIIE